MSDVVIYVCIRVSVWRYVLVCIAVMCVGSGHEFFFFFSFSVQSFLWRGETLITVPADYYSKSLTFYLVHVLHPAEENKEKSENEDLGENE